MYDDAVLRIPCDEPELWEILREQFFHVSEDFARPVETKKDGIDDRFHRISDGKTRRDGLRVIRYRNVGAELNNREHFLTMGRELLPFIEEALERENLTPEFVQQWGKLMFCHGYIASHVLDDSDGLTHQRAGDKTAKLRSKDAQRKWIAHHMVPLADAGWKRAEAEDRRLVEHVKQILRSKKFPQGFPEKWFKPIITRGGLAATYDEDHLSIKTMRTLLPERVDDIPPVTSLLP